MINPQINNTLNNHKTRLITLGQLTADISNEIHISLEKIRDAVYLLNMNIGTPDAEIQQSLTTLEENVANAERINNNLIEYVNSKSLNFSKIDINDLVRKALTRTSIPNAVEVVLQLNLEKSLSFGDSDKLLQVFENLLSNAIQSMPEGGFLIIKTEIVEQTWISISITDTGKGILKENLEKLFDPLFSINSKEIGIGLAVSKTLLERHSGWIEVESEFGKGSSFIVNLPLKDQGGG
ncbi:MAG: ATP-binding protein [Candidatus Thorarchaeota archaeon]